MSRILSVLPILLALDPCGTSNPSAPTFRPPSEVTDAGAPFSPEGTWAYRVVMSHWVESSSDDGLVLQTKTNYSVGVWTLDGSPTRVADLNRTCLLEVSNVNGYSVTMDPGYYQNTLNRQWNFEAPLVGATVTTPPSIHLFGVTLKDPNEALPTSPDDPRVTDYDGDGDPGYTVYIDATVDMLMWSVGRLFSELDGIVYASDHIAGHVYGYTEESVLYVDKPYLFDDDPTSIPEPDPAYNFYDLKRVPAGTTCEEILANRDALFGTL